MGENEKNDANAQKQNENPLRKMQLVELEILKHVVKICNENDITYYISGGTFLGAVRHKGFIPWDDDIDIAMPRTDYEKFRNIITTKLPKRYKYRNFKNDDEVKVCFSRIEDMEVKVKDTSAEKVDIRNAWIDIFPLDGMPKNKIKFLIRKYHLLYLRMMFQYSQYSVIVNQNLPDRPLHEKILVKIGKLIPFEKILNTRKYMYKIDKNLQKVKPEDSIYYMNFLGIYKFRSVMVKNEIYKEGALYEFEGDLYNGPKEYDKYLTQIYGDYMKIPKEENRNKHHIEVLEM